MNAVRRAQNAFDSFLFASLQPVVCSAIRISYATLLLVLVFFWMLDASTWFTASGVLTTATARELAAGEHWSIFLWLPERKEFIYIGLTVLFAQTVLLLLGCWSRFQAASIFFWLVSFQNRNPVICDGEDTVFRLFSFFMIFMPLDFAWSLRRSILRNRSSAGAKHEPALSPSAIAASAWALRLMQFQITAIYLSTAWSKWQGTTWRDGTALYYVSRMDDVFGRFWLPSFLFDTQWMVKLMTWSVLGVESLLPLMLWYRPTRRLAIVLAVGLHLSIEYSMHLFLFEWIMLVGLLSFVYPQEWFSHAMSRRTPLDPTR